MYWNQYNSKIESVIQAHNDSNYKRTLLDVAIPGINRLFVMGFNDNVQNVDLAHPDRDPADDVDRI